MRIGFLSLCCKAQRSCSFKRLRESREHRKVDMKLDAPQSTNAQRQKSVVVLQPSEFAFDSGSARVEMCRTNRSVSGFTAS
jgi:hypothetical protein